MEANKREYFSRNTQNNVLTFFKVFRNIGSVLKYIFKIIHYVFSNVYCHSQVLQLSDAL